MDGALVFPLMGGEPESNRPGWDSDAFLYQLGLDYEREDRASDEEMVWVHIRSAGI
ncbi:MAG: hypothetical protein M3P43_02340 [Actinomycetota bacterium]|nr:hypothetical protein [Actinomycetota bacterium]